MGAVSAFNDIFTKLKMSKFVKKGIVFFGTIGVGYVLMKTTGKAK
jgi:hypothetical protein